MYEELVKRLCTAQRQACLVAEETAKMPNTIFGEAADAIMKLSKELIDLKLLTCCCGEPPKEKT